VVKGNGSLCVITHFRITGISNSIDIERARMITTTISRQKELCQDKSSILFRMHVDEYGDTGITGQNVQQQKNMKEAEHCI
jgi:hypothetical protein